MTRSCAILFSSHADHDPARDDEALEALARWMMRFTPIVAIDGGRNLNSIGGFEKSAVRPANAGRPERNCIFLDLTGCERVFHGIDNIVRQIRAYLAQLKITARLAVAPTPGAAWALALAAENGVIVDDAHLLRSLAPLPPLALRIGDETAATLHHLGIETIGQLMELPRETLPCRFGESLLERLDQAVGRLPEPLVPLKPFMPIEARMDFDGVVESLETIWLVFKELLGRVIADLTRRGCGARGIEIDFIRPDAPPLRKTLQLSRPSRDPINLFNLLRCAMEKLETEPQRWRSDLCSRNARIASPFSVRQKATWASGLRSGAIDGFLGIHLKVPLFERLDHEQIALLEHEQYAGERELEQLIERLCIRLGPQAVIQPVLVESHVPESTWKRLERGSEAGGQRPGKKKPVSTASFPTSDPRDLIPPHRPLHLLANPIETGVMVSPSHDRDGRPILFNLRGKVHDVKHAVGPERICGQWWEGRHKTRDYFDVEDGIGQRFWIFRVMETGKWFLHGHFE